MDPQPSCSYCLSICADDQRLTADRMVNSALGRQRFSPTTATVRRSDRADSQSSSSSSSSSSFVLRPVLPSDRRRSEHSSPRTAAFHILLLAVIGLSLVVPADATSKNDSSAAANSFACTHMPSVINGLSRSRSQSRIDERTIPSRPIVGKVAFKGGGGRGVPPSIARNVSAVQTLFFRRSFESVYTEFDVLHRGNGDSADERERRRLSATDSR